MIKKLKKKFIIVALASVATLLIATLAIINVVNFALVTKDADRILDMLADRNGQFGPSFDGQFEATPDGQQASDPSEGQNGPQNGFSPFGPEGPMGGAGPMGPDSPDTRESVRFFTIAFDEDGQSRMIVYNMSAVTVEEAVSWASSLKSKNGGWTSTTYRFRTYVKDGETYVTVIDQSRELLPSFRVLWASIIGTVAGLLITFAVLLLLAERFVKPIAVSDVKQKKFIAQAARELKTPLTVLAIDKERLKDDSGESEITKSIDKQVDKLFDLTMRMNELVLLEDYDAEKQTVNISEIVDRTADTFKEQFVKRNITVNKSIKPDISYHGDSAMLEKMTYEIVENASHYSKSFFNVRLDDAGGRITLKLENDAEDLPPAGDLDTVFERFNKSEKSLGKGLGLPIVKAIVENHGGRAKAKSDGEKFIIKIELQKVHSSQFKVVRRVTRLQAFVGAPLGLL